ncbi:tetratricopeptide repeat protein [Tropicibacter oceani]|uniref:Cell division coordinator CpoB n=1 Tax=Tropicibacter oceani TaxID=3058420 RepID=A0ABY8QP33_9RHOB|nr:tetratricopeptide repeat protein [Tropicibacter oceani]WGW05791.1 tetratricopeptide repeat protein [Tropicibacter oceani]
MRRAVLALCVTLAAGLAQAQQSETLADIRQDIAILNGELQRLKQELNTTGSSGVAIGGSALDRLNAIEAELQRVTSKTEQLQFRIDTIVKDGTNRLGDLDFRVCEALPGCDLGTIGQTLPLGGEAVAAAPAQPATPPPGTDALPAHQGELAVSEEADFLAAQKALNDGDFAAAAQLFAQYREVYPMGPLEASALVAEGRALEGQGDIREAARRFLNAYSGFPDDPIAPEALWRLGTTLAALGSTPEACVTLAELGQRYPGSEYVQKAADSRAALGCQ